MLKRLFLAAIVSLSGFAASASAQVVREVVVFLEENGEDYVSYEGLRSNWSSYNIYWEKDKTLDTLLYFFPNEYTWDRTDPNNDILRLRQGDYSFIDDRSFTSEISRGEDGLIYFDSVSGDEDVDNPRFGYWNSPGDFDKFVYAWILPETIEVVDMEANRPGEWVVRENAIAWFGNDTNNVAFRITYRFKSEGTFEAVSESVGTREGVTMDRENGAVRVTLADTLLFPSGSAELSPTGRVLVEELSATLMEGENFIIVEGHTDNVPISGALTETFATNWELSAARALAVVRAMEDAGADPARLEARAYGEHRPVAENDTAEGRAVNRRISILIEQ